MLRQPNVEQLSISTVDCMILTILYMLQRNSIFMIMMLSSLKSNEQSDNILVLNNDLGHRYQTNFISMIYQFNWRLDKVPCKNSTKKIKIK